MVSGPTKKVFCSYSSADRAKVLPFARVLEGTGISVFMDERSIPLGTAFKDEITKSLLDADAMVLFWSAAAKESDWVAFEIDLWCKEKPEHRIIPVALDSTPLPPAVSRLQHCFVPSSVRSLIAGRTLQQFRDDSPPAERTCIEKNAKDLESSGSILTHHQCLKCSHIGTPKATLLTRWIVLRIIVGALQIALLIPITLREAGVLTYALLIGNGIGYIVLDTKAGKGKYRVGCRACRSGSLLDTFILDEAQFAGKLRDLRPWEREASSRDSGTS